VCALTVVEDTVVQESFTLSEAVTSSESTFWVVAMNEEIGPLHKSQTWDLVKLPDGLEQSPGQWYKHFMCIG
jgi:hypothetical protein